MNDMCKKKILKEFFFLPHLRTTECRKEVKAQKAKLTILTG